MIRCETSYVSDTTLRLVKEKDGFFCFSLCTRKYTEVSLKLPQNSRIKMKMSVTPWTCIILVLGGFFLLEY